MSKLLRRPTRVECFYCQSQVDPRDPRSFRCPECHCWNRYDAHGEIISDEPAMHDENLNSKSFARRASPRKDRIPSQYGTSVLFCHTCQTNQMLLSNLLSNYLPPPDDPEYEERLERLPEYRASVETRYPPVCSNCLPAVEEEIKRRDNMARTRALGGFLKDSRGKDKQRQVLKMHGEKEKFEQSLKMWRVRGCLWFGTLLCTLSVYSTVAAGFIIPSIPQIIFPVLPSTIFVSLLWTAWDPTYALVKRAELQGRAVRQRGRKEYNVLQSIIWLSRLIVSTLFSMRWLKPEWQFPPLKEPVSKNTRMVASFLLGMELLFVVRSVIVLRVQRPPAVHLLDDSSQRPSRTGLSPTPSSSRATSPASSTFPRTMAEGDLLAPLSLSNKPILPPSIHPVFGVPSLPIAPESSAAPTGDLSITEDEDEEMGEKEDDPDAMDWSPTSSPVKRKARPPHIKRDNDDGSWLRPQKFFAPEEPTGLENLFERTIKLVDTDSDQSALRHRHDRHVWVITRRQLRLCIAFLVTLLLLPVGSYVWWAWRSRKIYIGLSPVEDIDAS